ncbi:MAG: mechanosensitive ion channel [Bacteroidales bacterium]|jgi:small-conductance mechanosensitive channel|nr:mechanosensitive ion channel [Bacteroidales bacterium]
MNPINEFIQGLTGISPAIQAKLFTTLIIIIVLSIVRVSISRMVWRHTHDVKIRYQWKRMLSFIVPLLGGIMIAAVWASAFKQFGAFLGLMTAGLAIALKDLLTNIAGWIFILFRKPFVVGDRVQVGDHTGDIIDIRLFQLTMLEIGNWVEADQSTGRIIHLPNGKVFMEPQANYSSGFEYIWNEIPVLVTFESDWKEAKRILNSVIQNYAVDIDVKAQKEIREASKSYMIYYKHLTPIVYTAVEASGINLTIRYLCNPRRRRGTANDIWEDILVQFDANKDIQLAYPTTRFYTSEDSPKAE